MKRTQLAVVLSFLAVIFGLAGCGPKGPTTYDFAGKVTFKGGQIPLKSNESKSGDKLEVWLVKEGSGERKQAIVKDDGSFVFGEGNKPEAGKYRITVKWQVGGAFDAPDVLGGKYDDKNSPHFCTIPDDKEKTVDVTK